MLIPSRLFHHIGNHVPEYRIQKPEHQRLIATMLWHWVCQPRRHLEYVDWVPFSKQHIRDLWGSDTTMRRVCGYLYFVVLPGDNIVGRSSAFYPTSALKQALQDCLNDLKPDDLVRADGRVLRSLPRAIRSRSADGNNAKWRGAKCASAVKIDRPALVTLAVSTGNHIHRRAALQLLKLSYNTVCDGSVPVSYEQQSTGRIFSGLQTMPREVRNTALAGCWDYDIENCHYAIVKQMAAAAGRDCPIIDTYLKRKQAIRALLENATGASTIDVKAGLIALLYGARLTSSKKAALGDLLGREAAAIFIADPFVKALAADIVTARKAILAAQARRRGRFTNAMELEIDPAAADEAQVLCHLLQGVEATALRAVLRKYGDRVVLAMHDGWVSDAELDVDEIERLIKDATGYDLKIEARQIVPPPVDIAGAGMQNDETPDNEFLFENQWLADAELENRASSSVQRPASMPSGLRLSPRPQWNCPPGWSGARRRRADP
ncbi:hypothetical protein [Roseateles violae]|uniref:Uncharacterized protein n=1 Tax=Roseateles violae TaxID=3058042 RepID=A0ABT8DMG1_9BURK|nr:hypothetical protein [Pelomonas sp. PFR6]MDN3919113.1 hypothetical protein [Pelomonas sp. PFR6]